MERGRRLRRRQARAGGDRWRYGDPTDTKGGSDVRYWPTAKAFAALGRPAPDHPRYRGQ